MYNYQEYDDIPVPIREYVENVAVLDDITDISLDDVNTFLNETSEFYKDNGQNIEDFFA